MNRNYCRLAIFGLLGLTILAGCKAPETTSLPPELTPTQSSPTVTAETFSTPTAILATIYPGPINPVGTIYPEPVGPVGTVYPPPAGSIETVYPLPLAPSQAAYPAPTEGLSAYPGPNNPAQPAYPNPTQPGAAYPGPTQPPYPIPAVPPTAPLLNPAGPATPTSSPVPTNTPLPTATSAPTATPTPELPPPIRSGLVASDPALFKLDSGEVQLVEFFAYWCVTCRSMAPVIHSFEALYADRMNFIYLDIDDPAASRHKRSLGYRYQPHFFLLDRDGKILIQWVGWMTTEELRNAIEGALRK